MRIKGQEFRRFTVSKIGALFAAAAVIIVGSVNVSFGADKWRHGVLNAKGDAGILFMPTKFAEAHGLDLELIQFTSSSIFPKALIAGEIDSYTVQPHPTMAAIAQGAEIKFIGCDWPGMTYTMYGIPEVKSLDDLKGRSIAVSGPGSAPDLFAREVLRSAGIDESDVVFTQAGGGGDRFRAVVAGIVDVTATSSEFEEEAERRGVTILARAPDVTPDFLRFCIATMERTIEERRPTIVNFLSATIEGLRYALENPDETHQLAREIGGLADDDTAPEFIYEEAMRYEAINPSLEIPMERLQWNADMLTRHGVIDISLDVKEHVDDSLRQEALDKVDN